MKYLSNDLSSTSNTHFKHVLHAPSHQAQQARDSLGQPTEHQSKSNSSERNPQEAFPSGRDSYADPKVILKANEEEHDNENDGKILIRT